MYELWVGANLCVRPLPEVKKVVTYVGLLPDLFREGQGVVTTGKLDG